MELDVDQLHLVLHHLGGGGLLKNECRLCVGFLDFALLPSSATLREVHMVSTSLVSAEFHLVSFRENTGLFNMTFVYITSLICFERSNTYCCK